VDLFLQRHAADVIGVLRGFDRLVFRGTLRAITFPDGLKSFLCRRRVLLKDFDAYSKAVTERLKAASLAEAERLDRPRPFLQSPKTDKEALAQTIAVTDRIETGLVCVLKAQEPSLSFEIFRNREAKMRELKSRIRPSQALYHYLIDPVFGFMSARIQTYLPFRIQVCMNGREWLSRMLDREGVGYDRRDNCFASIEDVERAQKLMDTQLEVAWPEALQRIARQLNPAHDEIFEGTSIDYYWSVYQSEWATDLMFRDSATLAGLYPALVHHGIKSFSSPDVLRFLGREIRGGFAFQGEVVSDFKRRPEGVRVKHRVGQNSVKIYDKQGSVLRVETTVNDPSGFKVFRPAEGDPKGDNGKCAWRPLRRGVADLHRRAQVSQAANDEYLDALASVENTTPVGEVVKDVCRPVQWKGRRTRALEPWSEPDLPLLAAINRGEHCVNGFRNRDLVPLLYPDSPDTSDEKRRRMARTSRLVRLLRAHGLVRKVTRTHRYRLTPRGRVIATAVLATQAVSLQQLNAAAA
jgi:hypothetical protein